MDEKEIDIEINYIKYTLENYPNPENLEWSTEQIQALLSRVKALEESEAERERLSKLLIAERIRITEFQEGIKKHENETRAKFSSCVTDDDETLWELNKLSILDQPAPAQAKVAGRKEK